MRHKMGKDLSASSKQQAMHNSSHTHVMQMSLRKCRVCLDTALQSIDARDWRGVKKPHYRAHTPKYSTQTKAWKEILSEGKHSYVFPWGNRGWIIVGRKWAASTNILANALWLFGLVEKFDMTENVGTNYNLCTHWIIRCALWKFLLINWIFCEITSVHSGNWKEQWQRIAQAHVITMEGHAHKKHKKIWSITDRHF
jgi:hypothetical protein